MGERYPKKMYNRLLKMMHDARDDKEDQLRFETTFDNAYHDFRSRLQAEYTDLTPGDLRVCCLLRMNLSTKEVASMMNITVRGVELRRYRLRKRLALAQDVNLVDFLISF